MFKSHNPTADLSFCSRCFSYFYRNGLELCARCIGELNAMAPSNVTFDPVANEYVTYAGERVSAARLELTKKKTAPTPLPVSYDTKQILRILQQAQDRCTGRLKRLSYVDRDDIAFHLTTDITNQKMRKLVRKLLTKALARDIVYPEEK